MTQIVENPNFEYIFDFDILLFNTSLESMVLYTIFCHVVPNGKGEFVSGDDICLFTCGILKSIPLF